MKFLYRNGLGHAVLSADSEQTTYTENTLQKTYICRLNCIKFMRVDELYRFWIQNPQILYSESIDFGYIFVQKIRIHTKSTAITPPPPLKDRRF